MFVHITTLLVPTFLLALVFIPRRFANEKVAALRQLITIALGIQFFIAAGNFSWLLVQPVKELSFLQSTLSERFVDSLSHYDSISGMMFLLVSFVGLVVCKFSIRYLDGDTRQGTYFLWLGFTLGAVSLLVLAGNLVFFFAAWVMTSFGLHHLLMHFKDRPWARRAAWTKFAISRIGDVFLLAAMILVYREFGSYQLADILARAQEITDPSWQLSLVGWFLMLGAVTKSAQFPVHFWLPETMEAPTPVSALMHAGIVNAGGYLLVRWSPLVAHASGAMATLVVIGGFTAVFAGLVMMTQANVKRSLGYSTVAQMGFMMLQCGLGAFSAAMLHIIAHSLYKAHAFLRTGDAWRIEQIPKLNSSVITNAASSTSLFKRQVMFGISLLFAAGTVLFLVNWLPVDVTSKPGSIALVSIICLAFAGWYVQAYDVSWRGLGIALLMSVFLIYAYLISYLIVDDLIKAYLPSTIDLNYLNWLGIVIAVVFASLALLQAALPVAARSRRLRTLYVHVSNGFYVDTIIRRFLGLSLSQTPSAS